MIPTTAMMPKVTGTTTEARTGRMLKDVGSKPGHMQGVINITHILGKDHSKSQECCGYYDDSNVSYISLTTIRLLSHCVWCAYNNLVEAFTCLP